jgi:hypothetical protein
MAPYFSILEIKFIEIFKVSSIMIKKSALNQVATSNSGGESETEEKGGNLPLDHLLESRVPLRRRADDDELTT